MISPEIQQYVQQQIAAAKKQSLYSTSNKSSETHNGIDAPKISYKNITGIPTSTGALVNSGTASIPSNSGASPAQVAHGLGVVPNFVSISADSVIFSPGPSAYAWGGCYLQPNAVADDTYLYIFNTTPSSTVLSLPCVWYAAFIPI
jgi:hypothetical protein